MHPFTGTSGASLNNMSDLNTGLPFASQASRTPPTGTGQGPTPFALPREPAPPQAPEATSSARRLTRASYKTYVSALGAYVAAFSAWEAALLAQLGARHASDARVARRGAAALDTFGDEAGATAGGGVAVLARGAVDDERVLKAWAEAKARFGAAMEECVRVKERVRELGLGPA